MLERSFVQMPTHKTFTATLVLVAAVCWLAPTATGQTWFDRAGNFHSNALHVVERYTPRSPGTLMYEATIEDPYTFSRPSIIRVPLYRRVEENAELEFKCPEFAEEVLYGHLRRQPVD